MARMRAVLCVVLVATGCYSPGYVDCEVTCAMSGQCPDGLDCVGGVCRVGGNTGACGVPTSDGRTNDATDSGADIDGPLVTPNDEDNDGILNADDPCPISANNDDTDGDGVGDACEHVTGGPSDTLIRFEGFDGQPAGAMVVGSWSFTNGAAHIVSDANRADSITFPNTSPTQRRTTVIAKVTINGPLITTADPTSAGVVLRTDGAAIGTACGLGYYQATGTDSIMLLKMGGTVDTHVRSNPTPAQPGSTNVIAASRNPMNDIVSCGLPASTSSTVAFTPPSPIPAQTSTGIRTRSVSATFAWVMIIESPD